LGCAEGATKGTGSEEGEAIITTLGLLGTGAGVSLGLSEIGDGVPPIFTMVGLCGGPPVETAGDCDAGGSAGGMLPPITVGFRPVGTSVDGTAGCEFSPILMAVGLRLSPA